MGDTVPTTQETPLVAHTGYPSIQVDFCLIRVDVSPSVSRSITRPNSSRMSHSRYSFDRMFTRFDGCWMVVLGTAKGHTGVPPFGSSPEKTVLPSSHGSGARFCTPDRSSPRWKTPTPSSRTRIPSHEAPQQPSASWSLSTAAYAWSNPSRTNA